MQLFQKTNLLDPKMNLQPLLFRQNSDFVTNLYAFLKIKP